MKVAEYASLTVYFDYVLYILRYSKDIFTDSISTDVQLKQRSTFAKARVSFDPLSLEIRFHKCLLCSVPLEIIQDMAWELHPQNKEQERVGQVSLGDHLHVLNVEQLFYMSFYF